MKRRAGTSHAPRLLLLFASALLLPLPSSAQTASSDPRAVGLATKAWALLTGNQTIADVTLTGTATRTAGSDVETGETTLEALGTNNSRMDFAGSEGNRTEIRNSSSGFPQGAWFSADGVSHAMATHNCMTDAVWFFPAFSILGQASAPNVIAGYVGQETRNGAPVYHLRFSMQEPGMTGQAAALMTSLTTEDVYLDSASLLPVAIASNAHADTDASINVAVEIDFSNYQNVNGTLVPYKVEKLLNNSIFLQIEVQSAVLNSGLSASVFAIQ